MIFRTFIYMEYLLEKGDRKTRVLSPSSKVYAPVLKHERLCSDSCLSRGTASGVDTTVQHEERKQSLLSVTGTANPSRAMWAQMITLYQGQPFHLTPGPRNRLNQKKNCMEGLLESRSSFLSRTQSNFIYDTGVLISKFQECTCLSEWMEK